MGRVTTRRRRVGAALITGIVAVTLVACGGDDSASDDEAAAEDGGDDGGGDDGDDAQSEEPSDDAADDGGEDGGDDGGDDDSSEPRADLPDGFPDDIVPLPSSASVTSSSQVDSGDAIAYMVTFTSTDDPESTVDAIRDGLDGDWNEILRSSSGDGEFAAYATEEDGSGDQVSITVSDTNGQTEGMVQVVLYK